MICIHSPRQKQLTINNLAESERRSEMESVRATGTGSEGLSTIADSPHANAQLNPRS